MDKVHLRKKILDEIGKIKRDISELEEQTKPIAPENSLGRVSRMDAINNKSVVEASLRHAIDKQKNLQSAFDNLEHKDFGICIKCNQPIPEGRIMLMPHAKKCVNYS